MKNDNIRYTIIVIIKFIIILTKFALTILSKQKKLKLGLVRKQFSIDALITEQYFNKPKLNTRFQQLNNQPDSYIELVQDWCKCYNGTIVLSIQAFPQYSDKKDIFRYLITINMVYKLVFKCSLTKTSFFSAMCYK